LDRVGSVLVDQPAGVGCFGDKNKLLQQWLEVSSPNSIIRCAAHRASERMASDCGGTVGNDLAEAAVSVAASLVSSSTHK
jgi:hypothetical protein